MNEEMSIIFKRLTEIVGKDWVIKDRKFMESYLGDETPEPVRPSPAENLLLIKPNSTNEITKILRIADKKGIAVFPVGGRTGLVGGSIPVEPGIILSLERMKKIEIDRENLMAVVEAGATLQDLISISEAEGLFFPLHPGDLGAQIGGLISTNAGGVRAVKYGVMRNYVRGIEVALPNGSILNLGGKLLKNNTGYDLLDLIIGSEGTLCIITRAIVKLFPSSPFTITMIIPFDNRFDSLKSIPKILNSGVIPLAIEYVELKEILKSSKDLSEEWPLQKGESQLIFIFNGSNEEELLLKCQRVSEICEECHSGEAILAETKEEQAKILRIRSNIYPTLKHKIIDILDVTVPPNKMVELVESISEIERNRQIYLPVYGHAGDGNLHIHIMKGNNQNNEKVDCIKKEIYEIGTRLGGVLTGEHGIGLLRVKEMCLKMVEEVNLMKEIKRIFDPNGILNPGKVIPSF